MNKSILIIGAGSIGRFHLLSILKSKKFYDVTLLDKSLLALQESKQIYKKNPNNVNLKVVQNIKLIDRKYNIAILAVPADIRLNIFKKLVNVTKIKYYIFEKFLFQKSLEYHVAKKIIKDNRLNVWVNCWRRTFYLYKKIKDDLKKNEKIDITLSGNEWGLACNSIHFIDLFCWMNNYRSIVLNTKNIKDEIVESKRKGFIEFYGTLIGSQNKNYISMSCEKSNKKKLDIILKTTNKKIVINEIDGTINIEEFNKKKLVKFSSPKVSNITFPIVDEILNSKKCLLPTYNESAKFHLIMLNSMIDKVQIIKNTKISRLKIT